MKTQFFAIVAALVLNGCGGVNSGLEQDSEIASTSVSSLRVECLKTSEYRNLRTRDRITLTVQDKSVKLSRIVSQMSSSETVSKTQTISGPLNTVFDGTVVKKTHATLLLTPATHSSRAGESATETTLRHVIIEYSEGKLKVVGPDTKVILSHSNCRTAS
jgi:hypothetical protein